ncbi:MAG: aspartate--tRNA ligase, partial [Nitrospinales bacterium]
MEKLQDWRRTHSCGALNQQNVEQEVTLMGWVHRWRDHGGLIFIDLRDRYGMTQVVFDPKHSNHDYEKSKELPGEYVVAVKGRVKMRPKGMVNDKLPTGAVEVVVCAVKILNTSKTPPFGVDENKEISEDLRLKYRYLDLRSERMKRNLIVRHKTYQAVRKFLNVHDFVEVETPFLMRSTPEGARDYLVPSRLHHGKFYALPQSPQTYKQILMVAGLDRYFQIVRCFRDEDLRHDRQPEFTQIDIELSFVERDDVLEIIEQLMCSLLQEVLGVEVSRPFKRLTYHEAMTRYGTDKPDLRFGMPIVEISDLVRKCEFKVFTNTVAAGGIVCGILLQGGAKYSRKRIDELTASVTEAGAKGLVALKVSEEGWDSSLAKFFDRGTVQKINQTFDAKPGDLILLLADTRDRALVIAGGLRLKLAKDESLIPKETFALNWILEFPLLEYNSDEERFVACHHPFTAPMDEDIPLLESAPEKVRAKAYDLVLNGYEIAGGSLR